jgi:5-methylcytosine-specific restriction protein A
VKFTEKTRKTIEQRAAGMCEVCGSTVRTPQIHHRKPRGMGGTKKVESRSPANGLYVHLACHERIERNRTDAYTNGYLVHQYDSSEQIPVLTARGWVLLLDDGTTTKVEPAWDLEGKPVPRFLFPQDD